MTLLRKLKIRKRVSSLLMRKFPHAALRVSPIKSISIEASSRCNIKCLCCPVGNSVIKGHNMSINNFTRILDLLPSHIKQLDFSHRGDPTINPCLPEMVRLAYKKGFKTDVYTNGLILDRYIPELTESGLTTLRIDLDGASEDSYLSYRIGSNFKKVRSNIRLLIEARSKSKGKFPKNILIICVVTSFNENEIPEIQNMAKRLGVDGVLFKTAIINYGTKFYHDSSIQKKIAPSNKVYRRAKRPKNFLCPFLWRGAILDNGDLQICTADFEGEYILGNILKENSFEKIFYSEKANLLRKQVISQSGSLCGTCAVIGENHYMKSISRRFNR